MRYRVRKQGKIGLVTVLLSIILLLAQHYSWFGQAKKETTIDQPGLYSINHYVDGDTIVVNMNGVAETIRFIGIDTPETHKPNTPVQCYGPAASAHTKNAIEASGSKVRLVSDQLGSNRDRYNRLLRYVYLPDGTDLNKLNVGEGYAFYYPYFPFSKSTEYKAAQATAQNSKKGLWGACNPTQSDDGGYKMNETQAAASNK